jgi:SAM-dependent methyltransferase
VRHRDAVALISGAGFDAAPSVWADLGSGEGTFTRALASLLAPGSVVHAVDRDASAVAGVRASSPVRIVPHALDFVSAPWPVDVLDGILMANSLHYVRDQRGFLGLCVSRVAKGRFVIVEYDTSVASPWVPFPVPRAGLPGLFESVGFSVRFLGARRSVFRRAELYAAVAERGIINPVGA